MSKKAVKTHYGYKGKYAFEEEEFHISAKAQKGKHSDFGDYNPNKIARQKRRDNSKKYDHR